MKKYKGIFIQFIYDNNEKCHFIDGVTNYTINAENKDEALRKMLTHYYSELWYSSSDDISVDDFKILDSGKMEDELRNHQCEFDYFLEPIEEDIIVQNFELK